MHAQEWVISKCCIKQTELVDSFFDNYDESDIQLYNFFYSFISEYDVIFSDSREENQFFDRFIKEKEVLEYQMAELLNRNLRDNKLQYTKSLASKLNTLFDKVEENIIFHTDCSSKVINFLETVDWFLIPNKRIMTLLDEFNMPIVGLSGNYWLGVLDANLDFKDQSIFFKNLSAIQIIDKDEVDIDETIKLIESKLKSIYLYEENKSESDKLFEHIIYKKTNLIRIEGGDVFISKFKEQKNDKITRLSPSSPFNNLLEKE